MGDNGQSNPSDRNDRQKTDDHQQQQREGSIDRQQNQQRDQQPDDGAKTDNPGLEPSNRIDLDEQGRRDQQA